MTERSYFYYKYDRMKYAILSEPFLSNKQSDFINFLREEKHIITNKLDSFKNISKRHSNFK